jgi:hypothetical protein
LGKGCSWDLLYELSGVSAEVHRRWTLAFLDKFSKDMYPIYVHGPRDNEELSAVTSLYAASGFPGCVGSTDVVHIRWEMCPSVCVYVYVYVHVCEYMCVCMCMCMCVCVCMCVNPKLLGN